MQLLGINAIIALYATAPMKSGQACMINYWEALMHCFVGPMNVMIKQGL